MSDSGYQGIQLSLKRASDNALLNICGVTPEEFFAVKASLKDDPDLAGFFGGAAAPASGVPNLTVVPTQTTSANTTTHPAAAQQAGSEPAPVCEVCGTPKTWKPGGVSRAGKPYQGFWGCPNYRDGSHG